MDERTRNSIVAVVAEKAVVSNGRKRLSCAVAFAIADAHGVGRREIGKVCNEEGIAISACQLGCFS
ncbi:MAG: hypothetical protein ACYC9O_01605 [Candidatus Latescibacterota bacterium]